MPIIVIIAVYLIQALVLLIFLSSILSWFRPDPRHPLVRVVRALVDPLLHPIRVLIPPVGGMDFSPLVAFIILLVLKSLLQRGFSY